MAAWWAKATAYEDFKGPLGVGGCAPCCGARARRVGQQTAVWLAQTRLRSRRGWRTKHSGRGRGRGERFGRKRQRRRGRWGGAIVVCWRVWRVDAL